MRRMKGSIVLVLFILSIVAACTHKPALPVPVSNNDTTTNNNNDTTNNSNDTTVPPPPVDTSICFERDILPIFLSNCAKGGCHDAASHEEGYIFNSYTNIMNSGDDDGIVPGDADESEIFESITEDDDDDRMPQDSPPLTTAQINLIRRWINEGAQNGTNCVVLCDTNNFTYNAGIKPILQQNCIGCHNSTLTSDGVNLSTYNGVKTVAQDGRLLGTVKHQSGYPAMPQGAAKLSDCKIKQMEKWISAGYLEN
jgi:cytochrome c553